MLGRKTYAPDELDQCKSALDQQLAAYRTLADAVARAANPKLSAALEEFEKHLFNNLTLVLDRYFVHRLRGVAGKDGNPLNEVDLLADSLMNNQGTLRGSKVVKFVPEQSVTKVRVGDRISLNADEFERLARAFFAELSRKFL